MNILVVAVSLGPFISQIKINTRRKVMKQNITKVIVLFLLFSIGLTVVGHAEMKSNLDTAKIEQLIGLKGTMNEKEGVFKVSYPRKDLDISAGGVKITPSLGLTAWTAFTKAGNKTIITGDIVLLEDQVNPVMTAALDNGLEVTALHNHFFGDTPKVMFMHIGGTGDEEKLASAVGKVFETLQQTSGGKGTTLKADIDPAQSTLDSKTIDEILKTKGDMTNGVYKATFGRKTKMQRKEIGNAMGVNTWAAFAGANDKAVVDGDFAMLESELQEVLKTLRRNNINVVAIHNHMTMESPRIIFLHFWGIGSTQELAKGIKEALDTQNKKR
jgi:hypothetical protein